MPKCISYIEKTGKCNSSKGSCPNKSRNLVCKSKGEIQSGHLENKEFIIHSSMGDF